MDAEVIVAVIGAIGLVTASLVATLSNRAFLHRNLGRANGNGTVADMSELLIMAFQEHAELDTVRFDSIGDDIKRMTSQAAVDSLAARLAASDARVDLLAERTKVSNAVAVATDVVTTGAQDHFEEHEAHLDRQDETALADKADRGTDDEDI